MTDKPNNIISVKQVIKELLQMMASTNLGYDKVCGYLLEEIDKWEE